MTFTLADTLALADLLRDAARAEIMPRFRRLDAGDGARRRPARSIWSPRPTRRRSGRSRRRCIGVSRPASWSARKRLRPIRRCSAGWRAPIWPSWSIRSTAPRTSPPACRCSAPWRRHWCAARSSPRRSTTRSATTAALALRGEGAWIETPDGTRRDLRVAAPAPVARMTGAASWRYLPTRPARDGRGQPAAARRPAFDLRCAAHEYRTAGRRALPLPAVRTA